MFGMNSGYNGYSMSNRAFKAYENGEKPLSKWTKAAILEQIENWSKEDGNNLNVEISALKKLKASALKNLLLYNSSWHHTSSYVNKTDFYSVNFSRLEGLTEDDLKNAESNDLPAEAKTSNTFRGDIYYIEWTGTKKHPKATERSLTDVNIEEKGSFYIVTDDEGRQLLRKKIDSKGTYVKRA